jgi:hypothetical protein
MTIEQRVEALERELERLRRIVGGAVVGREPAPLVEEDIRAKRFTLVDEKGCRRVTVGMTEGVAWLKIFNENENIRALITVQKGGCWLKMLDEEEKIRLGQAMTESDPWMKGVDGSSIVQTLMGSFSGNEVFDLNGQFCGEAKWGLKGARLWLFDENGRPSHQWHPL